MEDAITIAAELPPPTPIRIETALSRYPVHRLARKGNITIEVNEEARGGATIKWKVSYNSEYGQPGPLAYKLDTLIINRRIEEAARPIPRIIKLGSLHDICRELGISEGKSRDNIKMALYQNASTFIKAKIRYRLNDGGEKSLEAGFNRYNVVFTGEELPDGRKADAVYIVLSDVYIQVINGAMTRPLDYDYLRSLPPAAQRFYELLSYQMYATVRNDRPRAKLVYSELCTYSPLTRHFDWEHARTQLAKIHAPHRQSGYIAKIDYEQTVDSNGQPDWLMFYLPGPKARAEYRAFAKRGGPVRLEVEPILAATPALAAPQQPALPLADPEPSPLEAELIGYGITPTHAAELVRQHDAEHIKTMIEYLEYEKARKPGKIDDQAAWLYSAIKDGRSKPKDFTTSAEREQQAEAARRRQQAEEEKRRRERQQTDREQKEKSAILAYWAELTPQQQAKLQAHADAQADPETLKHEEGPVNQPLKSLGQTIRRHEYIRQLLRDQGKLPPADA